MNTPDYFRNVPYWGANPEPQLTQYAKTNIDADIRYMRIGIHPALKRHDGGIYQYSVTMLRSLCALSDSLSHEFIVFAHEPDDPVLRELDHPAWTIQPFRPPWGPTPCVDLNSDCDLDRPLDQPDMREWLLECGVDLMLYPSPHRLSFESGIPFIMAIHDIQHVLQPEFPEVSGNGEWRRREYVLRNAARSATLIVAESEVGREDILHAYGRYGIEPDRVHTLPYFFDCAVDPLTAKEHASRVRARYALPERHMFYPAQFWPHKNHVRLVEAIGRLRKHHGLSIPLVLAGSGTGSIREQVVASVKAKAIEWGIEDQIRMLGYVSDEEVAGLHGGAEALLMPTFFGPTNIPFLEAWGLGCPVLTSHIRGIVEQVGDAAVTVDPRNIVEIADGVRMLWEDDALRRRLVAKGQARLAGYTRADFQSRLAGIIDQAAHRVGRAGRKGLIPVGKEIVR